VGGGGGGERKKLARVTMKRGWKRLSFHNSQPDFYTFNFLASFSF
jgi:hypothetical protein